jgi:hypothetical protein
LSPHVRAPPFGVAVDAAGFADDAGACADADAMAEAVAEPAADGALGAAVSDAAVDAVGAGGGGATGGALAVASAGAGGSGLEQAAAATSATADRASTVKRGPAMREIRGVIGRPRYRECVQGVRGVAGLAWQGANSTAAPGCE